MGEEGGRATEINGKSKNGRKKFSRVFLPLYRTRAQWGCGQVAAMTGWLLLLLSAAAATGSRRARRVQLRAAFDEQSGVARAPPR